MLKTIELDCAPGRLRPGDLLEGVIKGLSPLTMREPVSKLFGNWTWDFSEVPDAVWVELKPVLAHRITALHNAGLIRYGSW